MPSKEVNDSELPFARCVPGVIVDTGQHASKMLVTLSGKKHFCLLNCLEASEIPVRNYSALPLSTFIVNAWNGWPMDMITA